jgi:hypothetical protein
MTSNNPFTNIKQILERSDSFSPEALVAFTTAHAKMSLKQFQRCLSAKKIAVTDRLINHALLDDDDWNNDFDTELIDIMSKWYQSRNVQGTIFAWHTEFTAEEFDICITADEIPPSTPLLAPGLAAPGTAPSSPDATATQGQDDTASITSSE